MAEALLPAWLRLAAVVAFGAIAVVHLGHLRRGGRWERAWHVGHLLMALGMIDMVLPRWAAVPVALGQPVFAAAAALSVAIGAARLRRRRPGLPWFVAAVGHAGMLCMFVLPRPGFELLVWVLALWYCVAALGWATGRLPTEGGPSRAGAGPVGHLVATRVALVVMTLAMAYLLVAMELAMPASGSMPGM